MIKCKHLFPTWSLVLKKTLLQDKNKTLSTNHPKQKLSKNIKHKNNQATLIKKIGYSIP